MSRTPAGNPDVRELVSYCPARRAKIEALRERVAALLRREDSKMSRRDLPILPARASALHAAEERFRLGAITKQRLSQIRMWARGVCACGKPLAGATHLCRACVGPRRARTPGQRARRNAARAELRAALPVPPKPGPPRGYRYTCPVCREQGHFKKTCTLAMFRLAAHAQLSRREPGDGAIERVAR